MESKGFLSGLSRLFGDHPEKKESGQPVQSQDDLLKTLNQLQEKINAQRSALLATKAKLQVKPGASQRDFIKEDKKLALQKELEEARRQMKLEIEELHRKLGSGVDPALIPTLQEFAIDIANQIKQDNDNGIEGRARNAAYGVVLRRSAEIAWERLITLISGSGDTWPVPDNLPANASEDSIELARERSLSEARELFLGLNPQALAELMTGNVSAWRVSYPARTSWLWRQVALRGVGAGMQYQILQKVVTELRSEGEEIRQDIFAKLSNELNSLTQAIGKSASSIEDVDKLARTAGDAIESIVEERILAKSAPIFEQFLL